MPVVRLRAAIPESLISGSLSGAVGRAEGFSPSAIRDGASTWRKQLTALYNKAKLAATARGYQWASVPEPSAKFTPAGPSVIIRTQTLQSRRGAATSRRGGSVSGPPLEGSRREDGSPRRKGGASASFRDRSVARAGAPPQPLNGPPAPGRTSAEWIDIMPLGGPSLAAAISNGGLRPDEAAASTRGTPKQTNFISQASAVEAAGRTNVVVRQQPVMNRGGGALASFREGASPKDIHLDLGSSSGAPGAAEIAVPAPPPPHRFLTAFSMGGSTMQRREAPKVRRGASVELRRGDSVGRPPSSWTSAAAIRRPLQRSFDSPTATAILSNQSPSAMLLDKSLRGGSSRGANGAWSAMDASTPQAEQLFAGSALAFAFLYSGRVAPIVTLAGKQVETARLLRQRFGLVETQSGLSFNDLVDRFKILLGPDNMRTTWQWFSRARLWRFALLQDRAGFWDPSPDLAVALLAHKIRPESIVWAPKGLCFKKPAADYWEESPPDNPGDAADGAGLVADAVCPLAGFDAGAVAWCLPPELRELCGAKRRGRPPLDALRLWATLLSVASLQRFEESILVSRDGEADETLVDRAYTWLGMQEEAEPELRRLMPGLVAEAQRVVEGAWEQVHGISVRNARDEQMRIKDMHSLSQFTRASGHMLTQALVKHETMSCFTVGGGCPNRRRLALRQVCSARPLLQPLPCCSVCLVRD